jgi:hypothetical protein
MKFFTFALYFRGHPCPSRAAVLAALLNTKSSPAVAGRAESKDGIGRTKAAGQSGETEAGV